MEDINIGIFVVLMLVIALYHHPEETKRLVLLPLIGLYVVIDVILKILGSMVFSKRRENE